MSFQAAIHGRLGGDPREIPTRGQTLMVSGSVAVKIQTRDNEETLWLGLLAFGKQAESLLRHKSGDMVSASGRVQLNRWEKNGEQREQWQLVADSLVSARTVRPGGGKRKQQAQQPDFQAPAGFDDPLNF